MNRSKIVALLIAAAFTLVGVRADDAAAKAPKLKPQTTCPVMGGKIDKKLYADVDGKRIYVCCPGCIATIKKDPEKYLKKLKSEGVVLEDTPTAAEK
jgi:YHS domain-containing protein